MLIVVNIRMELIGYVKLILSKLQIDRKLKRRNKFTFPGHCMEMRLLDQIQFFISFNICPIQ